jgi:hypothetical protein
MLIFIFLGYIRLLFNHGRLYLPLVEVVLVTLAGPRVGDGKVKHCCTL